MKNILFILLTIPFLVHGALTIQTVPYDSLNKSNVVVVSATDDGTSRVATVALSGWPAQTQQVYVATSGWANAGNFDPAGAFGNATDQTWRAVSNAVIVGAAAGDTAVQPGALTSYTTWYDSTQVCLSVISAGGYATQGWVTGQLGSYYLNSNPSNYVTAAITNGLATTAGLATSSVAYATSAGTAGTATNCPAYLPLAGGTMVANSTLYVNQIGWMDSGLNSWSTHSSYGNLYFTPAGSFGYWMLPYAGSALTFASTADITAGLATVTPASIGAVATNDTRYLAALTNAAAFDPAGAAAVVQTNLNAVGATQAVNTAAISVLTTNTATLAYVVGVSNALAAVWQPGSPIYAASGTATIYYASGPLVSLVCTAATTIVVDPARAGYGSTNGLNQQVLMLLQGTNSVSWGAAGNTFAIPYTLTTTNTWTRYMVDCIGTNTFSVYGGLQ